MYYNEAVDSFDEYYELSRRYGRQIEGMPGTDNILPASDLEWISQKHYDSQSKFTLFGNTEKDELEKLLNRSGNAGVINKNVSKYRSEMEASMRQYRIERAKDLRRYYFSHIEKANGFVDEGDYKKAMKEYRKADKCWRDYFTYDYESDPQKDKMCETKFTPDAVEHMMVIYIQTHPLLTSRKKQLKINREITEMLDGRWDDKILKADWKAQEIHDEKQKRIEDVQKKIGEAIGDVMILGDKLFQKIRR